MQTIKKNLCFLVAVLFVTLATAQSEYYTSIDGVKGGATLKDALYNLIRVHERISYGSGSASTWGAFYSTDRDPVTNRVYDMYSPEVRYFGDKGAAISDMNIEHSVAKSWWGGGKNDAYCDLHHLNPSDADANSRKGNYPLAELESVSWDNGVTFVGKATINGSSVNAFEPCDEYKGDFARTYMYMFTCYQNLTYEYTWMNYENSTYPTFKPWAVELLLKWHKQDPVSAKEVARNNAVYSIQGNRNPYVDYPQLADYVWGDSVNYVFSLSGEVSGGAGDNTDSKVYIMESFSSSLGEFTVVNAAGTHEWTNKYGCAYISAYESDTYTNYAAESWLVSPSMDLTDAKGAKLSFEYVTKYNETGMVAQRNQLLISDNYTGDIATATWEVIDFSIVQNNTDWAFTQTGDIALPTKYMGKDNVTIAFKYTSTTTKAGTWEVKNLVVSATEAAGGDDNTDGDDDNTDEGGEGDDTGNVGTGGNGGNYPFKEFTLVTSASTLTAGDSIIIAYTDIVMGAQSGKYRASIAGAVIESNKITSYPEGTQIALLEEGTKEGTFAINVDGLYLSAASNSSNNVSSVEALSDDASWLIEISADGSAVLTAQGAYTRNILQYNTSSPRFSCYKGTQKSVNIYAKSPVSTTGVEDIVTDEATVVDVYNMQGVCVRSAVRAASALDNLPRGFYIISGEKVYKK